MAEQRFTLASFHAGSEQYNGEHTVLFVVGVGTPAGQEWPLHDEWELPPSFDCWAELTGTITDGVWRWDGRGKLTDWNGNTITRLEANRYNRDEMPGEIAEFLAELEPAAGE